MKGFKGVLASKGGPRAAQPSKNYESPLAVIHAALSRRIHWRWWLSGVCASVYLPDDPFWRAQRPEVGTGVVAFELRYG
jgi:hypothetical protein